MVTPVQVRLVAAGQRVAQSVDEAADQGIEMPGHGLAAPLRIVVHLCEHAEVGTPARIRPDDALQQRPRESVHDGLHRRRVMLFEDTIERLSPCLVEDLRPSLEQQVEQPLLASEMVLHQGDVGAGLARDLAQGDAIEPPVREQPFGGLEDAFLAAWIAA
ncbi:MAG: hypothetical protein P8008_05915 [Gammaproteobacteria bacterium]